MDIRNVELSVQDILSIHRHWVTKLYVEERRSEKEIVELLHERRLPVTISQIRRCLSNWDLPVSTLSSRRGSETSVSSIASSKGEWDFARSPSPASSTSSYFSTSPDNVELYSKRPLPSLPNSQSSSKATTTKPPRLRRITTTINNIHNSSQTPFRTTPFAPRTRSNVTKITSHQTKTRFYEVQTTLSPSENGQSPIEIFANDGQTHERLAFGLRRVKIKYPEDFKHDEGPEFEWMTQSKCFNINRRQVQLWQDGLDSDME